MILLRFMAEIVVILGASLNPGRYSYKARLALIEKGHTQVPVNGAAGLGQGKSFNSRGT